MGLFKKSCSVYSPRAKIDAPNPNPLKFTILHTEQFKNAVVARIVYPDCNTFEGVKICVFIGVTSAELEKLNEIDPHFSEGRYSPIARFKPTDYGLGLALILARSL